MITTYTNTGRQLLLEDYFNTTDLYLGLWKSTSGILTSNALTLPTFSSNYELTGSFKFYERIKIGKSKWLLHPLEFYIYPNSSIQFLASNDWNGLGGYFLATTPDNIGKLICYDTLKSQGEPINIQESKYLQIYPKIRIY